MYQELEDEMCPGGGATAPGDYGPGFAAMAENHGYDNFSWEWGWAFPAQYWNRCEDIDNGHPIGLMAVQFNYPRAPDEPHWIAMKGYQYPRDSIEHAICCTDSYTRQSWLWID